MWFLVSFPLKLSQVFVYWILAHCKTPKRIGTPDFINMHLLFVAINFPIACMSIVGHTMQGHTG